MEDNIFPNLDKLGYKVFKYLGCGAYGRVFQAFDERRKEWVAVKIMNFESADDNDNCQGLSSTSMREFTCLLYSRNKQNLMGIKDLFPSLKDRQLIYVMDYFPVDLSQYMVQSKGKIPEKEVMVIMRQILNGLFELHKMYYMHRDLKPGNIVYNPDTLELRLIDFGLSREPNMPCEEMSNEIASPAFRPIEVLFGSNQYTPAIDVWCAGIIFYELLFGHKPFTPRVKSDVGYMFEILSQLGTPSKTDSPTLFELKSCPKHLPRFKGSKSLFKSASKATLPLLEKLLKLDPCQRIPPEEALKEPFFKDYETVKTEMAAKRAQKKEPKLTNSRR